MKRIWKTLSSYVLWTHDRGNLHYDVMVTLILAFIFLTPRSLFQDSPNYRPVHPNEILVKPDGPNAFVYDVAASSVPAEESDVEGALKRALESIAGKIEVSRYEELRDTSGKLTGYRVWAHR